MDVGVAAHITAAAPGGPRYDPSLSPDQRADATNGIWLCQNCAKLVDNDPVQFGADLLRKWKSQAEAYSLQDIGKTATTEETTKIVDKWVSLGYEQKAGIAQNLKDQGFDLHWSSADKESERVDIDGYEHVLVDQPDGSQARLKIHDSPVVGGYLVLLKRKRTSR